MDTRVRALPDRYVQPEGWPADDLAYVLVIVDPAGLELEGPHAGLVAPPGVVGVTVYYAFDALDADGAFDETIIIHYQSAGVATTSLDGGCSTAPSTVSSWVGASGRSSSVTQLSDGKIVNDFTNVQEWGL